MSEWWVAFVMGAMVVYTPSILVLAWIVWSAIPQDDC